MAIPTTPHPHTIETHEGVSWDYSDEDCCCVADGVECEFDENEEACNYCGNYCDQNGG